MQRRMLMKKIFQEKSSIDPTWIREGFVSKRDSGTKGLEHDRIELCIPTSPGVA